jgi:hypothetical protein
MIISGLREANAKRTARAASLMVNSSWNSCQLLMPLHKILIMSAQHNKLCLRKISESAKDVDYI